MSSNVHKHVLRGDQSQLKGKKKGVFTVHEKPKTFFSEQKSRKCFHSSQEINKRIHNSQDICFKSFELHFSKITCFLATEEIPRSLFLSHVNRKEVILGLSISCFDSYFLYTYESHESWLWICRWSNANTFPILFLGNLLGVLTLTDLFVPCLAVPASPQVSAACSLTSSFGKYLWMLEVYGHS